MDSIELWKYNEYKSQQCRLYMHLREDESIRLLVLTVPVTSAAAPPYLRATSRAHYESRQPDRTKRHARTIITNTPQLCRTGTSIGRPRRSTCAGNATACRPCVTLRSRCANIAQGQKRCLLFGAYLLLHIIYLYAKSLVRNDPSVRRAHIPPLPWQIRLIDA